MAASQVIDIDTLLAPVSDEAPAGSDPRADASTGSLYYQVKDARNAARSEERSSVDTGRPAPEEWGTVVSAASELLSHRGKDLEVAAWLVEALVRTDGFAGLRDGLRVIAGIASRYWDGCFPELDEDGVEGKLVSIAGLSGAGAAGTLVQPIRLLPLTNGSTAAYSLWSYEQAVDLQKITDPARRQARLDAGAVSMEQFMQSVAETRSSDLAHTVALVDECLVALGEMASAFDAAAGAAAPPVSGLRELLSQVASSIRFFAADKLASAAIDDPAPVADGSVQMTAPGPEAEIAVRRIDGYASRNEALAELTRLASYFRKTEPHSPISYTLEDTVRRARMTLPELLAELAGDPTHVQRILLAAGIRNTET